MFRVRGISTASWPFFSTQSSRAHLTLPLGNLGGVNATAEASGISLSAADAALVKGMVERGDRQHDIAAWFGVNGGRIADIATGKKFAEVNPAPTRELPPPGPYIAGREAHAAIIALEAAAETVNTALFLIKERNIQGECANGALVSRRKSG